MNKKIVLGKAGFIVANKVKENYKYGYINNSGKKLLDLKYEEIVRIQNDNEKEDVYLVAYKNGHAGFYKNNKIILKHEYQNIEYDNINKLLLVQKNQKQGVANLKGNVNIPIEYDNILIAGNCINAQKDSTVTLFQPDGVKITNEKFISMFLTENNKYFICINKNDEYGVLDEKKNQLIENKYTLISYLWDDYFIAQNGGQFGVINSQGNIIVNFEYDSLQKIENMQIMEGIKNNKTYFIGHELKTVLQLENANIKQTEEYLQIFSIEENQNTYLDKFGNITDSKNIFKENKLFAIKQNKKWGFVDKNGNLKIEAKFDMVTDFNQYGFAGIYVNEKWGVIDETGKVLQEPKYTLSTDKIPNFIGKYYEEYLGYGERFFKYGVTI